MKGWNVKVALGGQFERGFGVKAAGFWVFGEGVDEEIGVKVAVLGSFGEFGGGGLEVQVAFCSSLRGDWG